jgi:hypothetical protein
MDVEHLAARTTDQGEHNPRNEMQAACGGDQAGDITGSYTDAAGVQHGFVRNPYGTITSFDPPESNQTTPTRINDGGAVAGFYQYRAGGVPPVGLSAYRSRRTAVNSSDT